ncbi:MAG: hypothetical protein J5965_26280 [Aeriscardovia sp.]|nr:hypothetical protein [Aeriscardovia sp.]
MIEMNIKIKLLLRYIYRVTEILLILSITAVIVSIGVNSHDNAEMGGLLSPIVVAIAWMWFVTLPLFLIVFVSFIRSIPPVSIFKKVVLSLHILNIVIWVLFYLFLPKPDPCDAALMEKHYVNYRNDMYDLVNYVRSSLDDSCSINLEYRNDKIREFAIEINSESKDCTCIENKKELEAILNLAGLSIQELTEIQEKMHKAGIIGIDIDKNPKSGWIGGKSTLLYRWYGVNRYQFALYDRPLTEQEKHDALLIKQYILYNDSVVFESYGGYPGQRGFPDKEQFQMKETTK